MALYAVTIFRTLKPEYQFPGRMKIAQAKIYTNAIDPETARANAYNQIFENDLNRYEHYETMTPQDLTGCELVNKSCTVELLLVGGGGRSGDALTIYPMGNIGSDIGGGGGGEVFYDPAHLINLETGSQTYNILVGGVATEGYHPYSKFDNMYANNGYGDPDGINKGRGGTSGNGRRGGLAVHFPFDDMYGDVAYNAGGGGGAGGKGQDVPGMINPGRGGEGGLGIVSSISGEPIEYGAGGCGGYLFFTNDFINTDIPYTKPSTPGPSVRPGSGAGDAYTLPTPGQGGGAGIMFVEHTRNTTPPDIRTIRSYQVNGGSGIVIIRYKSKDLKGCTGGIITTIGSDTIHTFRTDGALFTVPQALYVP